jgi:dipeptidyl aminopeptidase/acylaminoacyl peptidase
MKSLLLFLFFCLIITCQLSAKPISANSVFDNPDNSMMKLSPDGKFISVHIIDKKNHYLNLYNPQKFNIKSSLAIGNDNVLNDYNWLNDSQIFMDLTHKGKQVNIIANLVGKNLEPIYVQHEGYLVDRLLEQPSKLMFAKRKNNKTQNHQLFIIDINELLSGNFDDAYELEHNENSIVNYHFDNKLNRVMTGVYNEENKSIVIKSLPISGGRWETIITLENTDYDIEPLGFISENSLAVLTNKDSDKMVLRSFNIKEQTLGKIIYQHPIYDLISAGFTDEGLLDFVMFKQHGLNRKLYFDKGRSDFRKRLAKTFPNKEVYIVDRVASKNISLLYANGSDEPGQYYVYNQEVDKAANFFPSYTKLLDQKFFASTQLTVKTKDNTELEAFLTLPKGLDHSTLLVMPHGGPIDVQESDRFNKAVQYYASRGFSILRVNFRGSAGFGKEFLEQGVGEFGKKIEQDITAAVTQVKQIHKFKYQCAIGASYGGYSSTMLAINTPKEYDCVIGAFGIYDLPLLFNASNYRSGSSYQKDIERVVGKYDENLNAVSPVYLAKKLKAPILLIAGREDDIADFEHTNRLKYILNKLNHPVETMFYQKTGHGHSSWEGDIHEAAITYDFLMRTLQLETPASDLDENSKQAIADDYIAIADGYNFNNLVDNDDEKAFEYYQKSAHYGHPRANFNIGSHYHAGDKVSLDLNKAIDYYRTAASLNYANAYARIGRMYMDGEHFTKNWTIALEHLIKAQKLEDSPLNNIRLARFYCTAPESYKNIAKCIGLMDLAQYENISQNTLRNAKNQVREALAWAFSSAKLTTEEHRKLKTFARESFDLTVTDVSLENTRTGQFKFIESQVFNKKGEYNLLQKNEDILTSDDEETRFGLIFKVDVPGVNRNSDQTAIAARWIKTTPDGKKSYPMNTLLYGSPKGEWYFLYPFKNIIENATWTLEIHDLDQNLLYSENFKLTPSKSLKIVKASH